jgi:chromosome segregation ATPase
MDENDFKRLLEESAAETHRRMDERFDQVNERFAETNARFDQVDVRFEQVDARFEQIDARFDQVDARFDQVDARFDQVDARFEKVDARLEKVDARFEEVDERFGEADARAAGLKQHIDNIAVQMKMDFGIAVEAMRTDVQRVADGVLMVNEKLDRETADIRAEMRQGFAETQALLRFSHGQLDGRVTALERAAKR